MIAKIRAGLHFLRHLWTITRWASLAGGEADMIRARFSLEGKRCIWCGWFTAGAKVRPGEFAVYGCPYLFACSIECAEAWGRSHAAPGYRPCEPGWIVTRETTNAKA